MGNPIVTVLMPVYNAGQFLREAIDSILNQTFTDFEFLIINDGSTDTSEEIILSYKDPRIRYYKNEGNLKLIATLNRGFDFAQGKYIARMDADDISLPTRLQLLVGLMESKPEVGLAGTWFENFIDNQVTGTARYAPDHETICFTHLYQIHLSHGTCMFRTSVLKEHKLYFDPNYSHAEDYELWSRISAVTKLANIQQVLYRVRHHEGEVSRKYSDVQTNNSYRVKENLFNQIGIDITRSELDLLQAIAHHKYGANQVFLTDSKALLEKLLQAKNYEMFFPRPFYEKKLSEFWFNLNYNLTSVWGVTAYKNYFSSNKLQAQVDLLSKFKFLIKALIKK